MMLQSKHPASMRTRISRRIDACNDNQMVDHGHPCPQQGKNG